MSVARHPGAQGYGDQADVLFERYDSRTFNEIHAPVADLFPDPPASVVDIGAGSGRDAAHLAAAGYDVTAVEPTPEFLQRAQTTHPDPRILWLADALPRLGRLLALGRTFDLVLLTAVWMHLDTGEQKTGISRLAALAHSGSRVSLSLRHGPVPEGRRMFDVTADETIDLAAPHGFRPIFNRHMGSLQADNRASGVTWTRLVLEKI